MTHKSAEKLVGSWIAVGADGRVFVAIDKLSRDARKALRGRRRFVGVELQGAEVEAVRASVASAAVDATVALLVTLKG